MEIINNVDCLVEFQSVGILLCPILDSIPALACMDNIKTNFCEIRLFVPAPDVRCQVSIAHYMLTKHIQAYM